MLAVGNLLTSMASLFGGSLMFIAGIAYLLYGERSSGMSAGKEESKKDRSIDGLSRIAIGLQVGITHPIVFMT